MSLQGVLHFLEQRLEESAQHAIQRYAEGVYALVREDLVTSPPSPDRR